MIKLANGAKPLRVKADTDNQGNWDGVVLARYRDEFVTWRFGCKPGENTADCYNGEYFLITHYRDEAEAYQKAFSSFSHR